MGVFMVLAIAYGIRSIVSGRAHFDRVNKDGGSALLGKGMMEMAYWGLQPVGKALVFCRITANMLSWASLVFGFLAGAVMTVGHFGFGAVFATVAALLDSLDGMVARMSGRASDAGEVLDAAIDRYVEFFFLAGLVIYYREMPALLGLTLLAILGSFLVSYSTAKAEALQVEPPRGNMRRAERAVYLTLGAAIAPISIPFFEATRQTPVAIGYPMVVAIGIVALFSNVSAIERLHAIAKAVRIREEAKKNLKSKRPE